MSTRSFLDNLAAARLLSLLNMPFKSWKAHELGIIDIKGNTINKVSTQEQKNAWTYLHRVIRKVKQLMDRIPGARVAASIYALREHLEEDEFQVLEEAMVSGETNNIHAGTNTGAVVGTGPQKMKKRRIKDLEEYLTESMQFQMLMKDVDNMLTNNVKLSNKEKEDLIHRFSTVAQNSSTVKERDIDKLEAMLRQL